MKLNKKWMALLIVVAILVGGYFIKIGDDNIYVYLWKLVRGERGEVEE